MGERTYTWLGHTLPISRPDLPDSDVAGMVRMLMRDQLNHESICCMARDRIMCLSEELTTLRGIIADLTATYPLTLSEAQARVDAARKMMEKI